ncbi:MIT domain-containing protein [Sergentomyia squamirostris]
MSATELLMKAVDFDKSGRRMEAIKLYEEGANLLARTAQDQTDPAKKRHYEAKIKEYRSRAQFLKDQLKKLSSLGEVKDKIHIVENSKGHSYRSVFGKYLNVAVNEILLEESYLEKYHQLTNLVMFCELAVSNCSNLKFISVRTAKSSAPEQMEAFRQLQESLKEKGISFSVEFVDHIHDRQIILSNGYIVKIGRGLDYFKKVENKFSLGINDYDFRECKECNVDVLFCPENIR